jgi:predicted RNA-binding protein with PIN domain
MALLIDGYNLLWASGISGDPSRRGRGGLERSRAALLNLLAASLPEEELSRTIVVFDASEAPYGLSRTVEHKGLTVYFASRDSDADSLIEELIKRDSAPRKLTVVSSDHRLQKAAGRRRATAIDSDRWLAQLIRERQARLQANPSETIRPDGPLSPGEVEFWLKQFGGEETG